MDDFRRPHPAFEGRNGFEEQPSSLWLSRFCMKEMTVPCPTKEELLAQPSEVESLRAIKERIQKLEDRHLEHLDRLYECQVQEYLQEQEDRYYSKDSSQHLTKGENNPTLKASYAALDTLYKETSKPYIWRVEWDDQFDRIRHAHLQQILPLRQKRDELERKEEEARRKLDAQFPASVSEWRSIRNKEIQIRIAQFLMAEKREQEAMMTQYGWAHRQVNPLKNDYKIDTRFRGEIQSKIMEVELSARK